DDARDRVRTHESWRYVQSFFLEEALLNREIDDPVIGDREYAKGDVGLFDLALRTSRRRAGEKQQRRHRSNDAGCECSFYTSLSQWNPPVEAALRGRPVSVA